MQIVRMKALTSFRIGKTVIGPGREFECSEAEATALESRTPHRAVRVGPVARRHRPAGYQAPPGPRPHPPKTGSGAVPSGSNRKGAARVQ